MPRTIARPRAAQVEPPNTLVASAADVTRYSRLRPRRAAGLKDWQSQAFYFYDTVGEVRFAVNWLANALSRCRLVIKQETANGEEDEIESGPAVDALEALFGDMEQGQFLSTLGIHLSLAGESYLIGEVDDFDGTDTWGVYSTEEVSSTGQGDGTVWSVDRGDGKREIDGEGSLVIRIWRSHPRKWAEADAPLRAVLPVLRELEQLTKHVAATIDSRLAGAGILLLPSEMSFGAPGPQVGADTPGGTQAIEPVSFLETLGEAIMTPVDDRSSPAALVPVLVQAPGAILGNAQWLSFASPLDEQAKVLREEAIRRFALGMDLPPEIVLGQGDTSHWNVWQIDESALKVHIEPLLGLITSALTKQYVLPALRGRGQEPTVRTWVEADTSELRLRPDHSQDAKDLYDRLELSGEALRRENGFDESDAPDDEEIRTVLLKRTAQASVSPEVTTAALEELGLELDLPEPAPEPVTNVVALPPGEDSPQTRRELPARETPDQTDSVAAALMAPCELLVLRAVERAHNRLQGRNGRGKNRPPRGAYDQADVTWALDGAWELTPLVADRVGVSSEWLTERLDRYASLLLTSGVEHRPEAMEELLVEDRRVRAMSG